MKDIVILQTNIYRSNVTGHDGVEMGDGLAVQINPKIETLNSLQVSQIANAIKKALNGLHLDLETQEV